MALRCVLNAQRLFAFPRMSVRVRTLLRVNLIDSCAFRCSVHLEQEVMLRFGADNVLMTEDYDIG